MSGEGSNSIEKSHLDFDKVVQQEYEHLSRVHPDPKDIPGCWNLMSKYFECVGIKGQVKSLYRYGGMAECSQKMEDMRFCMSLKLLSPEEKREAWLMHRARWWAERRTSNSSEDVWDMREEPIQNYPPPPIEFVVDEKTKELTPIPKKT